jgi:CBS domain-containing protein
MTANRRIALMSVASIVNNRDHTIVSCTAHDSVQQAAKLLSDKRIGALPVLDGNKVAGIFSERDLLNCIAREGGEALKRSVGDVMTSPAITIEKEVDALKALSLMTKRRIRHLPVMEGEAMIGFVSIGDLVKYRMDRIEAEAEQMREYITSA